MPPSLLSFEGVSVSFGAQEVFSGLSFQLNSGQSTALLGLNGAGKSTLLRLAVDLQRPRAGTVSLSGMPVADPAARTDVAWLPERFTAPHYLHGREWLSLLLAQHGLAYSHPLAVAECARLDLAPSVLDAPVRHCSKGMMQKLGLAACLLSGSQLLLLDEPMSGLDPRARRQCRNRLLEAKAEGRALFMSSHELEDIPLLCERVLVLHEGRLVFDDTPAALCALHSSGKAEEGLLQLLEN
jgi:ABC-2 type transport system ATP-binding protein